MSLTTPPIFAVGIVVENNLLGGSEWLQTDKAREHGADVLSCSDNPSGQACNRGQTENKAYTTALATSTVVLLQENVGTRHLTDST